MKRIVSLSLILSIFLTSCAPKISTLVDKKYQPVPPQDKVLLLTSNYPIPSNAEFIGSVRVYDAGFSVKCGYKTVITKAKEEARKIGGNIIKLLEHKEPSFFGSSCHQIKAMIYKVDDLYDLKQEKNKDSIKEIKSIIKPVVVNKENKQGALQEQYVDKFKSKKGVDLSINGGYSYRTAKIPDNMGSLLNDYIRELKSGYNLGANLTYYYTDIVGLGIQYNMFKTSNHLSNINLIDINNNSAMGILEDNMTFNFIGASYSIRYFAGKKGHLFFSRIALGYLSYTDNAITPFESFSLTGSTFGSVFDIGYDMNIANNLYIGLQASSVGGIIQTFTKHNANNTTETIKLEKGNFESLHRLDFSIALKYSFK